MKKQIFKYTVCLIILFLSLTILVGLDWFEKSFGLIPFGQLIFHLKVPLEGANNNYLVDFINYLFTFINAYLPYFVGLLIISLLTILNRFEAKVQTEINVFFFGKQKKFKLQLFKSFGIFRKNLILISIIVLTICSTYSFYKLNIIDYFLNEFSNSQFFEGNYVDPQTVNIKFPEKKRNLIYIYLESMETTYASNNLGGAQSVNLIPELSDLAQSNVNFSNTSKLGGAIEVPNTNWTIAGMVSQTAGIPLNIPIEGNSYGEYSQFLPGAYAIGDILEKEGYSQTLMIGSKAEFGGRKNYFEQHGNYNIWDYNTAIEKGKISKDYYVWWGYEDIKLFSYAKEELTRLSQEDKPFNFTMLTADTHFTDGYKCELCRNDHPNQYSNVISCSSRQVSEFVSWIQEQDFYEKTTIVIVGDHLSMDAAFFSDINSSYNRTTYNTFINAPINSEYTKNRLFSSFDMFPTTVASLGASIEGNRLGLGTNLFSGDKTIIESMGIEEVRKNLKKNSRYYNKQILYSRSSNN